MTTEDSKAKTLDDLVLKVTALKQSGKKIVLCHGVFDLLHLGHIRYFRSAKKHGDVLIVTCTSDRHVKRGPGRPVFNQAQRLESLASLEVVDYVSVVDSPTAIEVIQKIQPHVYAKGPDYIRRSAEPTSKLPEEQKAVELYGGTLVFTEDESFSSSELINKHFDTYPQETSDYLKKLSPQTSVDQIRDYLDRLAKLRVLVIGDAIIDQYEYCSPLGKSAKENIIANRFLSRENFAGGVLATANNIAQLSENVRLVSVLGANDSQEEFIRGHLSPRIHPEFFARPDCVTTVKLRYIKADDKVKLFEVCKIDDHSLSPQEEEGIYALLEKELPEYDLVVVNDFGHGFITNRLKRLISEKAKLLALNVQTNSANTGFNLVTKYTRGDLVCIDELELRLATHDKHNELQSVLMKLYNALGPDLIICTRGRHGSISYSKETGFVETPAFAQSGVDKMGAGDAFFAYAACCFAVNTPPEIIGFVGNAVGALKLQIIGNRDSVKRADLLKFITRLLKV